MALAYKELDTVEVSRPRVDALAKSFDLFSRAVDWGGMNPKTYEVVEAKLRLLLMTVERRAEVSKLVTPFLNDGPISHVMLTTFFCGIIAHNSSWSSVRTTEYVMTAGLVHVCGLLGIPKDCVTKPLGDLTADEKKLYESYPLLGAQMVREADLPEPVAQAVLQHRETCDAYGFPNKLPANKIYPLAKILGLASELTQIVREQGIPPLKAIKLLAADRSILTRHDSDAIRSLLKAFIKGPGHAKG